MRPGEPVYANAHVPVCVCVCVCVCVRAAPLTYKDGALYTFANVFMLSWPYGYPKVRGQG